MKGLLVFNTLVAFWIMFDAPQHKRSWFWGLGAVLLPILSPVYLGMTRGALYSGYWFVAAVFVMAGWNFMSGS